MNTLRVIRTYLELAIARQTEFRAALYTEIIWGGLYTFSVLVFWQVLYGRTQSLAGWTFEGMAVYMGMVEVFWGLSRGTFASIRYFWQLINSGMIEPYLCRPFDARLGIILRYFDPVVMLRSTILVMLWGILATSHGWQPEPLRLLAALIVSVVSTLVYVEMALSVNYLAFIVGKMDAVNVVLGGMYDLLKYPGDIYGQLATLFLSVLIPSMGAATWPALIALGKQDIAVPLAVSIGLLVFWHGVQSLAWQYGLVRYESQGG